MKRGDWMIIAILLSCAVMFLVVLAAIKSPGKEAVVSIDGVEVLHAPLMQQQQSYSFTATDGMNTIVIGDGVAYVATSDCRDELCVHKGILKRTGDLAVCLPHRLVLRITGAGAPSFDAVVE